MPFSDALLKEALEVFQRYSKKPLTLADAEEALTNLVNFTLALGEAHREAMRDGKKPDEHDQTVAGR